MLAPLPAKGQVCWAWLTHFWAHTITNCETPTLPTAPARASALSYATRKCADGRGAIGRALGFVSCQQPFGYVHLLALMVDLALVANGAAAGMIVASKDILKVSGRVEPSPDHQRTCSRSALTNHSHGSCQITTVIYAGLKCILLPLAYYGLLRLGGRLDNPFRRDLMDLPCYEYGSYFKGDFEAISGGIGKVGDTWWPR